MMQHPRRLYSDFATFLAKYFEGKVQKISIHAGFTCPNRDGTCGTRGCLFCSAGGSGDFAENALVGLTAMIIVVEIIRIVRNVKNGIFAIADRLMNMQI